MRIDILGKDILENRDILAPTQKSLTAKIYINI